MPQLTPDHPSRPINTTSLRPQPCPLFPYAGPGPIMPTLSPIRHARHDVYDYDQFPSDIEPSCSTSCSRTSSPSPSPDYFGLSLSPPFSPSDFQRQKNADCTSEDGYADDDFAFGLWARPHPRHFTEIDPLSVHEVEDGLSYRHLEEYMIGYSSFTAGDDDEACCGKGIYFTVIMDDTATEFSSIATTSRASSCCIDATSPGSLGQEGYPYHSDQPAVHTTTRRGRMARPSASQRYSPLSLVRRAKTSKILDWVAGVERVRAKSPGLQSSTKEKPRLLDSDEVLYNIDQDDNSCSSSASTSRSFRSSIQEVEPGPVFAISSPCPTEIILSTSPLSHLSSHALDWEGVDGSFERSRQGGPRHMPAYAPSHSSKRSSPYQLPVTGTAPLILDDIVANRSRDAVDDKQSEELAFRFHRMGRVSTEMGTVEVQEEISFSRDGYMQTTTTTTTVTTSATDPVDPIDPYVPSSSSYHPVHSSSCCTDGSCVWGSCGAMGSGRWYSARSNDTYEQPTRAEVTEGTFSSLGSHPMSLNRRSFHGSSLGTQSSYVPIHKRGASDDSSYSELHESPYIPLERHGVEAPTQSSITESVPLYQPQPIRPILAISISELAAAEESGISQSPTKSKRMKHSSKDVESSSKRSVYPSWDQLPPRC